MIWRLFLIVVFTIGVAVAVSRPRIEAYGYGQRREVARPAEDYVVAGGLLAFVNLLVLVWGRD